MSNKLAESKSLWNYSLSPGWTQQEVEVLKLALMKFGIGRWRLIEKSGVLPTKSIQQCYLQTQRLIGQQSLAEFMGLHLDIDIIANINKNIQGVRKQGFLVNQMGKLTPEQKKQLIEANRKKFGLSQEEIEAIKLPHTAQLCEIYDISKITNSKSKLSIVEKINHLLKLETALLNKLELMRTKKVSKKNPTHQNSGSNAIYVNSDATFEKNSDVDEDEEEQQQKQSASKKTPKITLEEDGEVLYSNHRRRKLND